MAEHGKAPVWARFLTASTACFAAGYASLQIVELIVQPTFFAMAALAGIVCAGIGGVIYFMSRRS